MADIHLSPTEISKLNLINEGIKKEKIFIVGNPGIDNFVDNLIKIRSKKLPIELHQLSFTIYFFIIF